MNILFIDDDETSSKLLSFAITKYNSNCKVSIVNSLDLLDYSTISDFDLIILDLLMPGSDGIDCLRDFSVKGVTCPIILVSGLQCKVLQSAQNVGTNYGLNIIGIFRKPVPLDSFLTLISETHSKEKKTFIKPKQEFTFTAQDLESALRENQFVLYFQPQLSFSDMSLTGFEALIRWQHPDHGLLGPGFFLPLVESSGMAEEVTLWVIRSALEALQTLEHSISFSGTMSVNVPPLILNNYQLADKIINLVSSTPVQPRKLQLEITESSLENNFVASLDVQTRLAMRGFHLSIDDFGTGFSSLARLSDSYFDELKLDQFFIKKALVSQKDQTILINMINMGHQMSMSVVAEGIEDLETFKWLKLHGCDIAQGFLLARPMPVNILEEWVRNELPTLKTQLQ